MINGKLTVLQDEEGEVAQGDEQGEARYFQTTPQVSRFSGRMTAMYTLTELCNKIGITYIVDK